MRQALIVFGKHPISGAVKTRLTSRLTPDEAATLYAAFLEDALRQYGSLDVDVRLYMAGDGTAGREMAGLSRPAAVAVLKQEGGGLGARMMHAFEETFQAGYGQAVIVGTDHPTLPPSFIEQAFDALRETGIVVVGPAEDGGFYLLGMNEPHPDIFRNMEYGHSGVLEETLHRIQRSAAGVRVLPSWYDVDRPEQLPRLLSDLEADEDAAPRTRAALREIARQYRWLQA